MSNKSYFFHFLLPAIFFISISSLAQKNIPDIKNLSQKADLIIEGKVIEKKSHWNQNKTRIFTEVTVQVKDYLKGEKGNDNVVITTPGGEVNGVGELYTHMPRFDNSENVLVFLKKNKNNKNYKVFNGEEGKITLHTDKVTGEKVTTFNKKISSLKKEIKDYVNKHNQLR